MTKRTGTGLLIAVGAIALLAAACSGGSPPASAEATSRADRGSLLFFINPNGRPCQMQAEILEGARAQVEARAHIMYVSTERPEDRGTFHRYGIRALPSLVVVDASGAEVQRLPPGVQSADRILAATGRL